jgi:hypothetical protein
MPKRDQKDALEDYLRHAEEEMLPKMKQSALSLLLHQKDPDAKLCLELGAAILYNKPIIVMVTDGSPVPANLARLASAVVQGDINDASTKARLQSAIENAIRNDERAKRKPC